MCYTLIMPQGNNILRLVQLSQEDRTIFYKNVIFIIINIALAALGSLFILSVLHQFNLVVLLAGIIFLSLWCGLLVIYFLVGRWKYLWLGLLLIDCALLTPVILLHQYSHNYFWIIGGIIFVCLIFSAFKIRKEADTLVHLNWWRIIQKGSWNLSLVILLVTGYLFYSSGEILKLNSGQVVDSLIKITSKSNLLPYNISGTVDELSQSIIKSQFVSSQGSNKAMETLMVTQVRKNFSQFLGQQLNGKEKISEVLVKWVQQKWQNLSIITRRLILLVVLLLMINVVSLFNFFFSFVLFLVSWLIRELLIAIKFIKLKRIGVEQETLSII